MSEAMKGIVPTRLLWVDLEMTGLVPDKDLILEIAAVVTDFGGNELATYEAVVQHPREQVAQLMDINPWYEQFPDNKAAFLDVCEQGKPETLVVSELVDFVKAHFGDEPAVLAGNSIHNDRNFIKYWWPDFDATLHYRMLDVSSWKVFMQGRYGVSYPKKETHRALQDIRESREELEYYLKWLRGTEATVGNSK